MNVLTAIVVGVLVIFVVALIASLPFMLLWDWLMPQIFGLPEITWLQALGMLVMSGFLFKQSGNSK